MTKKKKVNQGQKTSPPTKFKKGQIHKAEAVAPVPQKKKPLLTSLLPYLVIALMTVLVYANTLVNDYALDDAIVITLNDYTQKGIDGIKDIFTTELFTGFFKVKKDLVAGGRYRPLSVATFALEYQFFGMNPFVGHLNNLLFFMLTGFVLYRVLKKLFQRFEARYWYLSLPFIATILYVVHPLHTEVVSNIKGRDEIFALLGSLITLYYAIRYTEQKKFAFLVYSFIAFFLALISKESAIPFIAIIPLALYFFTPARTGRIFATLIPIGIAALFFLYIRQMVLGVQTGDIPKELMNDSFLEATTGQKYATIVYTLGLYIKLLFYPHPLTYDYYPYHIPLLEWTDWRVLLSLVIHLGLIALAIWGFLKKHLIAFAIILYAASLSITSNLVFPIGTFMSERFMYIPSLGFCLIVAWFFSVRISGWIKAPKSYLFLTGVMVLIVVGLLAGKTIVRNGDWKNDFTLFTHDVTVSVNGAKSNCSAGGKLIEEAIKKGNEGIRTEYLQKAIRYLQHAIAIHPTYGDALLLLGNGYWEYNKNIDSVMSAYKTILAINPNHERVWGNLEIIFGQYDSTDKKISIYEGLARLNPDRFEINYGLGMLYGRMKNDLNKSIFFLEKAVLARPNSKEANKDLGVAYGFARQYEKALKYLETASALDPKDAQTLMNIGITYELTGNKEKAAEYYSRAKQIDPNIK